MKAKTVKEVLVAARWIIANVGWCQGAFARKSDGTAIWGNVMDGGGTPLTDGNCFCPFGALGVVETSDHLWSEALHLLANLPVLGNCSIAVFNDESHRTKEEVLELFDQAIEKAMTMFDRQRYITHLTHGNYPAGTQCWISRSSPDKLTLEFDDGTVIELDGHKYYAKGFEPRWTGSEWEMETIDAVSEEVAKDIDQQVVNEIDVVLDKVEDITKCKVCGHDMSRSRVKRQQVPWTVKCGKCKTVHEVSIRIPKELEGVFKIEEDK